MPKIKFTKMVASGNDFVVIEAKKVKPGSGNLSNLARTLCDRKYGVGADGLLVLEKTPSGGVKMRIFNSDGSEAEMCGNGSRCASLWTGLKTLNLETRAGAIESIVKKDQVKIKLTDPKGLRLDIPLKINNRGLKVNFINTGVPHAVIFVSGLDKIDVQGIGRSIRYHNKFSPEGTNVDFIEVLGKDALRIRTYERGVEDETLACGTGSVAAALIFALKADVSNKVYVHTKSGEILKIYFNKDDSRFADVWLEGKAQAVYKGEYHV
ncbi:MAG: diaminopimelate epimerase [Candidatus Omnitrophica bacterium]|nr:diaminopimelate epimerase [Candidatus Omnitrophota bacterium]MDD5027577.1 diaminopimelate epimerase [Candidatus Omnitrophota bacterium]MDD5662377.1 diaminopimelate epimerase [Candidatus Omnitrophota bacterium]